MRYDNAYYDDETVERVLKHAHRLVDEMCTVRDVAEWSGFSKSAVHNDITKKLLRIDGELAEEAQLVLQLNAEESALRGGKATAKKWQGS